jgi:hypothetical protein
MLDPAAHLPAAGTAPVPIDGLDHDPDQIVVDTLDIDDPEPVQAEQN